MQYRDLGKTGLKVSEVGFGAEWMSGDDQEFTHQVVRHAEEAGINIVDCWMVDPAVRRALGTAVCENRDKWIVQGHFGATWQDGQYKRTRDMGAVVPAWEFLLDCFGGHIELGLIHYVDKLDEFDQIMHGPFIEYVRAEKAAGHIDHIGLSTHNTEVALEATKYPEIEMMMVSINPAYDMVPPSEDVLEIVQANNCQSGTDNIDPQRRELHRICAVRGIGLTIMKPFAGGRLLDADKSPFGATMTPTQCISYCLSRPAVASVMTGFRNVEECDGCVAYETATAEERDFGPVLAHAPEHAYFGQCIYCGHCQPCVVNINIAQVNKLSDLAQAHDAIPDSVRDHYAVLDAHAGDCIACHTCEENCPFGVKIADRMEQTAEIFGY
jgi:predicted aldo/keto reductase-like oxidoreductase